MKFMEYRRADAVAYAKKWAIQGNPQFFNYANLGGDCTNFASQVLWAGGSPMNYDPGRGWYYIDANRKSPSWTGVNFLYNFLIHNQGPGPFAELVKPDQMEVGDLVQLSFQGGGIFNHSLPVIHLEPPYSPDRILTATHSPNQLNIKVSDYSWADIRFIHIKGSHY